MTDNNQIKLNIIFLDGSKQIHTNIVFTSIHIKQEIIMNQSKVLNLNHSHNLFH